MVGHVGMQASMLVSAWACVRAGVCARAWQVSLCATGCMHVATHTHTHTHVPLALKNVENIQCGPHAQMFGDPCAR